MNSFQRIANTLVGPPREFPLEHRLFNFVALLNAVSNIGGTALSLAGLQPAATPFLTCLHAVSAAGFLACYIIGRKHRTYRPLFWPFVLLIAVFLSTNLVANAGYGGGAHYYLPVALVIAITLATGWRHALAASLLFVAISTTLFVVQAQHPEWFTPHPSPEVAHSDLMTNFIFAQVLLGLVVVALANGLNRERQKSDRLLTNILPAQVADELKENDRVEPRLYPTATIMFTDTVGFTAIAEKLEPRQLIDQLDDNFGFFDNIATRNKIEKIKTIGDAYMAAGGVPDPTPTHAIDVVLAALQIQQESIARQQEADTPVRWQHRIGIHSGPLYAGVIGSTKFAYDVWGDTVNTASRLETAAPPDGINISAETAALVDDFFVTQPRGRIPAKNKGEIEMFLVTAIRPELSKDDAGTEPDERFWQKHQQLSRSL